MLKTANQFTVDRIRDIVQDNTELHGFFGHHTPGNGVRGVVQRFDRVKHALSGFPTDFRRIIQHIRHRGRRYAG